jgi:hypothetical protein
VPGVAIAYACAACAKEIGNPPEHDPDVHVTYIHEHHVPELQAIGWVYTTYPRQPPRYKREPPDIMCPHYHAANWIGDGDDDGPNP